MNDADHRAALLRVVAGITGPVVPDADSWPQWVAFANRERVVPLLYELVDRAPTDLRDDQRDQVASMQEVAMSRCVRVEHHLLDVVALLDDVGIRSAALKGVATAHVDYPTPAWRDFVDIDVLVDVADLPRATTLLEHDRWAQSYALPPGHERSTHAVTFSRDGVELDLHQRIGHRALGLLVPTRELLDRREPFTVAGTTVHALDPRARLVHSAIHAVSSSGLTRHLSSVADVLLGTALHVGDAAEVLADAESWQVRSLLERAIEVSHSEAHLELDPAWLAAMASPVRRRDPLVDLAYLGPRRRPALEELAYLRLLPAWSDRWRYVRGHLVARGDPNEPNGRRSAWAHARYVAGKLLPRRPSAPS